MNKTAIKNFAIWARNKLITDIRYKAGLMGITEKGIDYPLPQSTQSVQFFDIGTKEPYAISGIEIEQRRKLVDLIKSKEEESDYKTALKYVIEEVAYTWFNRLIAIRFMEVNDYLPTRVRVLSSESDNKMEPDLVTHALDVELNYSNYERERIAQLKLDSKLDDLFRMLFIKQCNALDENLPKLFEKTSDYTELLLNVSFTDKEGVVYHLVNDITENDFNVTKEGQIEIIGWLYQYYNTEPKDETFALLKKNVKITKERIPAATQLFTPEWIVQYMVENSLGRLWVEGHPNEELKSTWKYYLEEAEQELEVQRELEKIREEYRILKPENIKVIDPAMGSGHILVYAFDVLMQIYEGAGFTRRDAARSIVENNLYGLDIDTRAYQLAYFAVMMKARQYDRRILDKNDKVKCNLHVIQESNGLNRNQLKYFGPHLSNMEKNTALLQIEEILDTLIDAKEYGSIIKMNKYNWALINDFVSSFGIDNQQSFDLIGIDDTKEKLLILLEIAIILAGKFDVVITNPPYMGSSGMGFKLTDYVKRNFPDSKADLFAVFIERCTQYTGKNRFQSMITQHAFMFLSSFEKLRLKLLLYNTINMIHLGARAFEEIAGEVVQTTAFVLRKSNVKKMKSKYIRLVEYNTQNMKNDAFHHQENRFVTKNENFSTIPGSPIAYWVNENILGCFDKGTPFSQVANPKVGMQTSNNDKYLRYWTEVRFDEFMSNKKKWIKYVKGGSYRRWYGNLDWLVHYNGDPAYILKQKNSRVLPESELELLKCTWTDLATSRFSCRIAPVDSFHDISGHCFYPKAENQLYLLAYSNTKVFQLLIDLLNSSLHYQVGDVSRIPIIQSKVYKERVEKISKECIDISKMDWDSVETSWDFKKHPFIGGFSLRNAYNDWEEETNNRFNLLKKNEEELNSIFIDIYGLQSELVSDIDYKEVTVRKADLFVDIHSFISYAVGCKFGRFSLDYEGVVYAGGEWHNSKYESFIPDQDNIIPITDEQYLNDDIVGRFVEYVKVVYGPETLEENLDFIANALGNKGNTSREVIRNYFVKDFFKDHCKTYQKRPIYWLFDSGKQNGFKALVYMHRYDQDTIGDLRIDYLHKIQRIYENEIKRMQDIIDNNSDAREVSAAIKRKDKLLKQLQETKDYDEKIAHLALARTSIDLDDGVKVNYDKVQTDKEGKKLDVLAKI